MGGGWIENNLTDTLHLDKCKKCSNRIFEKNSRFRDFGQFCHFWPFLAKKTWFLDIFFESALQICLKLVQKLGTVSLNHVLALLCLGKFLFRLFWPFLCQKYIACDDIIWFLALFGPPRSGWDLWFSFRSSVRSSVRPFVRSFGRDLENGS